jgi:hypothetical protein
MPRSAVLGLMGGAEQKIDAPPEPDPRPRGRKKGR